MSIKTWDLNSLAEKIEKEESEIAQRTSVKYDDNYINDLKNFSAFQMVGNFLACNFDYLDKSVLKIDSVDSLKERLRYYEIGIVSNLDQRFNNLSFQHPDTHCLFPQFVEILSKKSKRCKFCKKFVVQMEENLQTKKNNQKLDLCHLFIKQFPVCYIYKIEPKQKIIYLKFVIIDLKEIKIAFKQAEDSQLKLDLPINRYELKYSLSQTVATISDNYVLNEGDRFIIFKICWEDENEYDSPEINPNNLPAKNKGTPLIFRFILNVEYPRTEPVEIDYKMEIKFKI